MNFELTKEQALLKKAAQQFAENTLEPTAAELDETHVFPVENFKQMARYGFTGIGVPKEYGGVGGGMTEEVIAVSEFAKKCMASAATLSIHLIAPQAIAKYGTEAQKQKYLPRLTKGGELGAFALTEPGAGSDVQGAQTVAVEDGDDYIITGSKVFTTNSGFADTCVVFALTDRSVPAAKGMTAFIVDLKEMPGITVSENIQRMGIRAASNCIVTYDKVRVPKDRVLGKVGSGFKIAMKALDAGRIGIAAQAVGIAQGALNEAIKYGKERKQQDRYVGRLAQFFQAAALTHKAGILTDQAKDQADDQQQISGVGDVPPRHVAVDGKDGPVFVLVIGGLEETVAFYIQYVIHKDPLFAVFPVHMDDHFALVGRGTGGTGIAG